MEGQNFLCDIVKRPFSSIYGQGKQFLELLLYAGNQSSYKVAALIVRFCDQMRVNKKVTVT